MSVLRVLHDNNRHPFKLTKVQHLHPGDPPLRLDYCQWLRAQIAENPNFLTLICSTDEKTFAREGSFNAHNNHFWSEANPHAMHLRGYQQRFSVNVWAGIVGDYLLGPYILPVRLNGPNYLIFLQEQFSEYLDELPLQLWRDMWWQPDGCPAHFDRNVRDHLNQVFPNRWIGRGGPRPWPPRSAEITPPDFFLWGAMDRLIYATPVPSEEDLVARIVMAGEVIRRKEGIFADMRAAWEARINKCIEVNGHQIEHLL